MSAETSIYEYARGGMKADPRKTALRFFGRTISFQQLFQHVDHVSDNLYAMGVRQGTVVTIHLPNCPQAVMAIYAVARLGGICDMVHALTPAETVAADMVHTNSRFLITHQPWRFDPKPAVIAVDLACDMGPIPRLGYRLKNRNRAKPGQTRFETLTNPAATGAALPDGGSLAGECAVYLHSSGSTGKPKTVCLSHGAVNHCAANTADFFEHGDMARQVSLGVLPLFHGFGLVMDVHRNLVFGSELVMLPRWNAKSAVKLIKKHGVTLMVGVPAMYYGLLKEPGFRGKGIAQLSQCYVGGDRVPPELIQAFDERIDGKRHLFTGFGLTEATTTNLVNSYLHDRPGSCGYPVRNTQVAVLEDDGMLCASGQGELLIRSKTMMLGYLNDPDATADSLVTIGGKQWVRTGDVVRIDQDGFVWFESRAKDIIIRNGYNIYPVQIETVIRQVPGVQEVCVVGVTEEETLTQRVRAVIVPGQECNCEALCRQIRMVCQERLPRYAVPGEIQFMDALPRNSMGKLDRKELSKP